MKVSNFTKKFLVLFLGVTLVMSCSKDDDNSGGQSDNNPKADITFFQKEIVLPQALQNQTDMHAQDLVSRVESIKSFGMYAAFTQVPPGADVSHEPIDATGSFDRPEPTTLSSTNYTVYTYSYGGEVTIAYQFSVQDGMDVVEIFYSSPETNGFVKYMDIRQTQDGNNGTMKFFGFEDGSYLYKWTWQINDDGSILINFNIGQDIDGNISYEMLYHEDMSGYLKYYEGSTLSLEFNWNANGSGNWTNYLDGTSGSW